MLLIGMWNVKIKAEYIDYVADVDIVSTSERNGRDGSINNWVYKFQDDKVTKWIAIPL